MEQYPSKCEHCHKPMHNCYKAYNLNKNKVLWVCSECLKLEIKKRLNNWKVGNVI